MTNVVLIERPAEAVAVGLVEPLRIESVDRCPSNRLGTAPKHP